MSNALAIAAVTSTVRYVLERALSAPHPGPVGGAMVTTLRPDRLSDTSLVTTPGINLYVYDVRPNPAWNLTDLPTRDQVGAFARRPVAALDLHYLLTYYGEDDSLDAQRLLGRAVLALAVTPILTRDVVAAAIAAYSPDVATAFLAESDLADQIERVKIAPHTQSVEEMSKLWATFSTPHRLSQTYVATAVLIEADVTPRQALPVQRRDFRVDASGPAVLHAVRVDPPGSATTGERVVLEGTGLLAGQPGHTRVRIGPAVLNPEPGATAQRIEIALDDTVPAGLHATRIVHTVQSGAEPERAVGGSNSLPLLVRPAVAIADIATDIVLSATPPLLAGQRATVLLSRLVPGDPETVALRFAPVAPADAPLAELVVPRADVPNGQWLVRVQVDGVDSVPQLVGGVYAEPSLVMP